MRRSSLLAVFLCVAAPLSSARADDPQSLEDQVEKKSPAIVSLRYVMKSEFMGEGSESNEEAVGAVADPSGLVLLSSDHFSGSPRQLKVLFGTDPTEHEAVLVAKDVPLGLAWVQVLDLGDKAIPAVDLTKPAEIKVGLALFGVSRSSRGFDYAPSVERLYVSAKIEKPRSMWGIAGEFSEAGLPVYDLAGAAVGVLSEQGGSDAVAEDGGGSSSRTCLLPLDAVARSLALAKKRVPEAIAKAKEAKESKESKESKDPAAAMDGAGGEVPAKPADPEKEPAKPEAPKPPEQPK